MATTEVEVSAVLISTPAPSTGGEAPPADPVNPVRNAESGQLGQSTSLDQVSPMPAPAEDVETDTGKPLNMTLRVANLAEGPEIDPVVATASLARVYKVVAALDDEVDDTAQVFYHEGTEEIVLGELRDQLAMLPELVLDPPPTDMSSRMGTPKLGQSARSC